jgi:hypothetical protein
VVSVDELDAMKVGDEIEADGLFPPLSKEPLVLRASARTEDSVDFVVTYFGVTLGKWQATQDGGSVKWKF